MPTALLTIAYEGTHYAGWQRQLGQPTVQQCLEEAFAAIDCPGIHVEGAGRTDAGVHALAQCAHVRLPRPFPVERLPIALNTNLPDDIAVRAARAVPDDFHARFCARGKRYVYRCVVSRTRPAIGRYLMHWVKRPVDLHAMRTAAACLVGEHDFAAFASNPGYPRQRGTVRTLRAVHLPATKPGFDFAVEGSGFLYNMVRALIGSLLEVGFGNKPVEWFREVLESRDRNFASTTAPASGLYLLRVLYAPDLSPGPAPPLMRGPAGEDLPEIDD